MLNTFLSNMAHAIRNNEYCVLGGGIFTTDELKSVLDNIELLYSLTIRPKQFIGEYVVTTRAGKVVFIANDWLDADNAQDMGKGRLFWKWDSKKKGYYLENYCLGKGLE